MSDATGGDLILLVERMRNRSFLKKPRGLRLNSQSAHSAFIACLVDNKSDSSFSKLVSLPVRPADYLIPLYNMLRHLKMELKRQEAQKEAQTVCNMENSVPEIKHTNETITTKTPEKQRRVRGRRSSKPMMEKRRRARINQCLDILKNYVLSDSNNLSQFGVDTSSSENHNEESIVRTILKSSGLINRHRGRKNPSNLEKADVLELTVDYVRRLHHHRDQLMQLHEKYLSTRGQPESPLSQQVPINQPLVLQVPASSTTISLLPQAVPPSPPSSTTSISPQPLLSIVNSNLPSLANNIHSTSDILDLSNTRLDQKNDREFNGLTSDTCWRPWHQKLNVQYH